MLRGAFCAATAAALWLGFVGEGAAAVPSIRNPIRFSETPADYRLAPPRLDEHGADLRRWLAQSDGAGPDLGGAP